jgi:hypothetical protein
MMNSAKKRVDFHWPETIGRRRAGNNELSVVFNLGLQLYRLQCAPREMALWWGRRRIGSTSETSCGSDLRARFRRSPRDHLGHGLGLFLLRERAQIGWAYRWRGPESRRGGLRM